MQMTRNCSLNQLHVLTIYANREDMFTHALHYLKQGLDKNQGVLLITNLFSINMALTMMTNLWGKDHKGQLEGKGDILIANTLDRPFEYESYGSGNVVSIMNAMTALALEECGRDFRIFADLGILFEHDLKSLLENESKFQTWPHLNLTTVCGYLQSEIMGLNPDTFALLQGCHSNAYVVP